MDTKEKRRSAGRKAASSAASKSRGQKVPVRVRRRTPVKQRRMEVPEVVYTQPQAFNKSAFLLRLVTVVAVVLALTLGMSIFFKVENVTVSGMEKYSAWDVRQASGIQEGENLLTLSKAMISGKITTALPYVNSVRIGIKLPDTVNIEITELDVAYAIEGDDGWWLMTAGGRLVEAITGTEAQSYTRILGVKVTGGQAGQQAVAAEETADTTAETDGETDASEESVTAATAAPVTVMGSERLQMAISILQTLESNSIIGDVTVVDVTSINQLELWYEDRYQVALGDSSQLDRKIRSMKEAAAQMTDYQSGHLDVSFTTWTDMVGFTPFEEESA